MAKEADISGKRLIGLAPEAWVRWALGLDDVTACELLSSEFQLLSRLSDALVRATSRAFGDFLTLFELQLRYPPDMPLRMRAYTGLAEEAYRLPVYPVLINVLPPGPNVPIPARYETTFLGLQARQDYRVINLWEVPVETVLEGEWVRLLPLVPVLRGGRDEAALQQALQRIRTDASLQRDERRGDLETTLAIFAGYVFETDNLIKIARMDMDIFTESPFYQWIVQQGTQQGIQQGIQQGMQLEREAIILRLLKKRLGELDEVTQTRIRQLPAERAEALAEDLLDFTQAEDLEAWLAQNELPQ